MNKYDMGLVRIEKLESCKTRLKELNEYVEQIDKEMRKLGGTFSIRVMQDLLDRIIKSFAEVEFLDKESYCSFINEIKEIENTCDKIDALYRKIGSDFGNFSLFEYIVLATDLLEYATYDSIICPDYPCTSEIIYNGKFSYYLTSDPTNEIVIDSPEKCWDYLKENYDAIED